MTRQTEDIRTKKLIGLFFVIALVLSVLPASASSLPDVIARETWILPTQASSGHKNVIAITDKSQGKWNVSGDNFSIQFSVENISESDTVIAFELLVVPLNPWGEPVDYIDTYRLVTMKTIAPGKTGFSEKLSLSHRSETYKIAVGIHRVLLEGEIYYEIAPEDMDWWTWTGPFTGK